MPLKKKNGAELRLTFQTHVGLTSIVHQEQRGGNWCWAACVSMVLQGLDRALSQCELAGMVLPTSCKEPCNAKEKAYLECDVPYPIEGIKALWKVFKVKAAPPQGPISSQAVLNELEAGRALQVLLGANADGGHLVLMIDAKRESDDSVKILVADPSSYVHDASPTNLKEALKDLGWGEWQLTWTGLHL